MALPQDNYKQQYGDSLGTSAALNETINCFLTLSMDRKNTGGIYWYYYGGNIRFDTVVTTIAPGALILTNATNYIEVDLNGTVTFNATGFTYGKMPVAIVTVAGGAITGYDDKRSFLNNDSIVNFSELTKEPTGFTDPANIVVLYDNSARTVTLTGNVEGYFKGVQITALTSGWVSAAHTATNGIWFLYFDGVNFIWALNTPWTFDMVQIAVVNYGAVNKWATRECHGFMPWQAHKEFHETIGTYKISGGGLSSYVLASTTPGDRRPAVAATVLADEDLETTNPALTSDLFTTQYISGATSSIINNFAVDYAEIVPVLGNNPYYNQFTGGAWQQTLMANNSYMSVWLIAIPTCAGLTCQKYRYVWIQGQTNNIGLTVIQAEKSFELNLGTLKNLTPEFNFISRLILKYTGGNWHIHSVEDLNTNNILQINSPAGNYVTGPAGDDKEVQFNDGGVFGADPNFLWDKTLNKMTVNGSATFFTTTESTLSGQAGVSIKNDFNITGAPIALSLEGNLQSSANHTYGIFGNLTLEPANTKHARFHYLGGVINAVAGRTVQADGLFIPTFTKTGTGTISYTYGIILDPQTIGTKNYGHFQQGSAMFNYFEGAIAIGQTTPTYKLQITPTAGVTAGQTVLFQDATATTGSTKLVLKSGAGQSTNTLEEWQDISANIMASMSQTVFTSPATLQLKNGTKFNSFTNSGSQAAGTLAYTLPAAYPAASGYSLTSTDAGVMSWVDVSGGGATPGGGDTAVQVNVGGTFWGDETQFWHLTATNTLGISLGKVQIQSAGLAGGIDGMSLTYAGSGYTLDDILYVSTTPGSGGYIKVTGVDGGGAVLSFSVYRRGTAYTVSSSIATTGGTGTNCYVNIDSIMDITQPALSLIDVHGTKQVTFNVSDEQTGSTNINYILPASYPATDGDVMSCTTDGIMSWITAGGGGSSPFTQDGTTFSIRRTDEDITGNTRGDSAIDLVYNRSSATMVAAGDYSGILSGLNHTNNCLKAVICGGSENTILETDLTFPYGEQYYGRSFIGAGRGNNIGSGNYARQCVIGGGYSNIIYGSSDTACCFIGGGNQNTIASATGATAHWHFIGGGIVNTIVADTSCLIVGGYNNDISISSGYPSPAYSSIVGGTANDIHSEYSFIGGGQLNVIPAGGVGWNTITGGYHNTCIDGWGFLGGGSSNLCRSGYAVVVGGKSNTNGTTGNYGFVGGGESNYQNSPWGFIGGGKSNSTSGNYSAVVGGFTNVITAEYSVIFGGRNNIINAAGMGVYYNFDSTAGGYNATSSHSNTFIWSDGTAIATDRINQFKISATGGALFNINNGESFDFRYDGVNSLLHSSGAALVGGVWTDASSRALKTKISDIDNADILQKVNSISPERWKYKTESDTDTEHIGLYAEDFYKAFRIGNDKGLGATDLCGVLWAAVQELSKQVNELKNKIQ